MGMEMGMVMSLKPLSACSRHSLVVWILTAQHFLQPESKFAKSRQHRISAVMLDCQENPEAMRARLLHLIKAPA